MNPFKWRKVPKYPKWSLHVGGDHVASISLVPGGGEWRVWLVSGERWVRLSNPVVASDSEVAKVKAIAEAAYTELVKRNASEGAVKP